MGSRTRIWFWFGGLNCNIILFYFGLVSFYTALCQTDQTFWTMSRGWNNCSSIRQNRKGKSVPFRHCIVYLGVNQINLNATLICCTNKSHCYYSLAKHFGVGVSGKNELFHLTIFQSELCVDLLTAFHLSTRHSFHSCCFDSMLFPPVWSLLCLLVSMMPFFFLLVHFLSLIYILVHFALTPLHQGSLKLRHKWSASEMGRALTSAQTNLTEKMQCSLLNGQNDSGVNANLDSRNSRRDTYSTSMNMNNIFLATL